MAEADAIMLPGSKKLHAASVDFNLALQWFSRWLRHLFPSSPQPSPEFFSEKRGLLVIPSVVVVHGGKMSEQKSIENWVN